MSIEHSNDSVPASRHGGPGWLTIDQVADYCGISRSTVVRRINAGLLAAHKTGRLVRIRPADVEAFMGLPFNKSVLARASRRHK